MNTLFKKAALGLALGASALTAAAPADAQYYRGDRYRHHDNDAAVAIGAGVVGLALGAAIASSGRDRYYDRGYYYNRGYYYDGGYAYPRYRYYRPYPHWRGSYYDGPRYRGYDRYYRYDRPYRGW